jgi:hypothetical protein
VKERERECSFSFIEVLPPVENISTGWTGICFPLYENDMPPLNSGESFELGIFPMGILLVWFVGKWRIDKWFLSLVVNTAILILNLYYCIDVAIFLFTTAVFISSSK